MNVVLATNRHVSAISRMMLNEISSSASRFPSALLERFRAHAAPESVAEELQNPALVGFVAMEGTALAGFIVGYAEKEKIVIHYLAGDTEAKRRLLSRVIAHCRKSRIPLLEADTLEFLPNDTFFNEAGFALERKEPLAPGLELLWYELKICE